MNKKYVFILCIVSLKKGKVHIVITMCFLFVCFLTFGTLQLCEIYIYINSTVYTTQINMDRNKGNSLILRVNECKTILGLNE